MNIRLATQADAQILAKLIFASAPELLAITLDVDTKFSATNFLRNNLQTADGQYGYANHWVAEINHQVVGCISAWHSDLPNTFHQATLRKLSEFYGLVHTLSVVHVSQVLQDCIPKPEKDELCFGHFAVLNTFQKQGVGSALLSFIHKKALGSGKSVLSLDVQSSNTQALDFYFKKGFVQQSESGVSQRMKTLGIGSHLHLCKRLI